MLITQDGSQRRHRHKYKPIIVLFDIQVLLVPSQGALLRAQIPFTQKEKPIVD